MSYDTQYDRANVQGRHATLTPSSRRAGGRLMPADYDGNYGGLEGNSAQGAMVGGGTDQGGYRGGFDRHSAGAGLRSADYERLVSIPRSGGPYSSPATDYAQGYDGLGRHSGMDAANPGYERGFEGEGGNSRQGPGYISGMEAGGGGRGMVSLPGGTAYFNALERHGGNSGQMPGDFDAAYPTPKGRDAKTMGAEAVAYAMRYDKEHVQGSFPYSEPEAEPQVPDEEDWLYPSRDQRVPVFSKDNVAWVGGDEYNTNRWPDLYAAAMEHDERAQWWGDKHKPAMRANGTFDGAWLKKTAQGTGELSREAALELKISEIYGR
jgi:hypothetical protein